jgi:hypothetical protein
VQSDFLVLLVVKGGFFKHCNERYRVRILIFIDHGYKRVLPTAHLLRPKLGHSQL